MTTLAKGAGSQLAFIAEATYGTTPATPGFTTLEFAGESMGLARDSLASNAINATRNRKFHSYGNLQVGGDINGEFVYSQWDEFISSAMFENWTATNAIASADHSGGAGVNFITITADVASSFPTGRKVVITGSTANDGSYTLASDAVYTASTKLIFTEALTDSTADGDVDAFIINGITQQPVSIEKKITSTAADLYFRHVGCLADTMNIVMGQNALTTISFGFMGQNELTTGIVSGATYSDAANLGINPLDSFSGYLNEGGSASNIVTGITLNVANNLEAAFVVGQTTLKEIIEGALIIVSGTLSLYIENLTLYNKFVNGTALSLEFQFTDPNSGIVLDDTYTFFLPNIRYTGNSAPIAGSGAVINNMPFEAIAAGSGAGAYTCLIARHPATDA